MGIESCRIPVCPDQDSNYSNQKIVKLSSYGAVFFLPIDGILTSERLAAMLE